MLSETFLASGFIRHKRWSSHHRWTGPRDPLTARLHLQLLLHLHSKGLQRWHCIELPPFCFAEKMEATSKSSNFMIFMLVGLVVGVSSPRCTEDGLSGCFVGLPQDISGPFRTSDMDRYGMCGQEVTEVMQKLPR